MGTGTVSTYRGDYTFQSADDVINFIRTAAPENNDVWISGEQPYPCIAVCINGEYAAVNFFQNDIGEMWLSYNDKNQKEVTFMAGGDEWSPDIDAIIALNDAFSCIREFLDTLERPSCIQWQKL
ncbi:MAG: hypothetical protein HDR11_15580 [Lachnospiraceae bacterium]|nr:hypothetical protein [Lachnospiraceae bacterium]MBD5511493.1 hypothetical protein [Lachnospiraceae bacterium]